MLEHLLTSTHLPLSTREKRSPSHFPYSLRTQVHPCYCRSFLRIGGKELNEVIDLDLEISCIGVALGLVLDDEDCAGSLTCDCRGVLDAW